MPRRDVTVSFLARFSAVEESKKYVSSVSKAYPPTKLTMTIGRRQSLLLLTILVQCSAWSSHVTPRSATRSKTQRLQPLAAVRKNGPNSAGAALATATLCGLLLTSPAPAVAYDASDYASDTVTAAVQSLKDARGNPELTVKAYENIAEIITEGKGVGGDINYKGIQLERGYVADEDTTIYNPGLTLLTESEKDRLTEAVIQARKAGLSANQWNVDTQAGFDFLREKLDPLHMYELKGYLGIVPFYGAALYLGVLAVQQVARGLFPVAYIAAAAAFFGPILLLVAIGPQ